MAKLKMQVTCVNMPQRLVPALREMIDTATDITARTLRQHCDLNPVARDLGYAVGREQGLHIADDYHVSYHKGKLAGEPCYFIKWSAIEHIFMNDAAWWRVNGRTT